MKNIILVLLFLSGATALIQSQSSIIYDAETALDIQSGADVCTDSLIMNGAFTGNGSVCGLVIGIIPVSVEIPKAYELFSNYPNPFNPATKIRFSIPRSTYTKLTIFNVTGKAVAVLVNENVSPGKYEVDWDASQSASGVYYYMLEADGFKATKKDGINKIIQIMFYAEITEKLFNADVTIAPVVSVNDEEVKIYNTVAEAIAELENDPKVPKEKLGKLKTAVSELKLTGKVKIKNGEIIPEETK